MPKSSASSATRKKQAQKAASKQAKQSSGPSFEITDNPHTDQGNKTSKKKSKNEPPRKKQYIAPIKPRGNVDPVDLYGLQGSVQPQTVVILRRLNKKDEKTLFKALEDLEAWLHDVGAIEDEIIAALPVWISHFPRLATHFSRRIRALVASIQRTLSRSTTVNVRVALLSSINVDNQAFIGSWLLLAHDVDRATKLEASRGWKDAVIESAMGEETHGIRLTSSASGLLSFLSDTIESCAIETQLNSSSELTSGEEANTSALSFTASDSLDEDDLTKASRLLTAAIDSISYLFTHRDPENEDLYHTYVDTDFIWCFLDNNKTSITTPSIRKACWTFLNVVLSAKTELAEEALSSISRHALYGALEEDSVFVQNGMWSAFLTLLQRE